jgi:uncharacterized protein (TIGR03437 family)
MRPRREKVSVVSIKKAVFYTGLVCLSASGASVRAQSAPSINAGGVINAASSEPGAPLAPGSIASAYGDFLLSAPYLAPGVPLPLALDGLSLSFGGIGAPLLYASEGQVNLQIPWELAGESQASLTATLAGQTSAAQAVNLVPVSPGIFTINTLGTGQGAILDQSYSLVNASNPATAGSTYLQIYCTGLGTVTNQPASGAPSPSVPLAETLVTPTVIIGGVPTKAVFSGLAPGFVGEYQVNAQVPATAATGSAVPVVLSIGGVLSNVATIASQSGVTKQVVMTAADGSAAFPDLTVSVSDLASQQPLTGIRVLLLDDGINEMVVASDPSDHYLPALSLVGNEAAATRRSGADTARVSFVWSLNMISTAYLNPTDSTTTNAALQANGLLAAIPCQVSGSRVTLSDLNQQAWNLLLSGGANQFQGAGIDFLLYNLAASLPEAISTPVEVVSAVLDLGGPAYDLGITTGLQNQGYCPNQQFALCYDPSDGIAQVYPLESPQGCSTTPPPGSYPSGSIVTKTIPIAPPSTTVSVAGPTPMNPPMAADGSFTASNLIPGSYDVTVFAPGYIPQGQIVKVESNQQTSAVVTLAPYTSTSQPFIQAVTPIVAQASQGIIIDGSGFGNTPPQTSSLSDGSVVTITCNVTTPALAIRDNGAGANLWEAGQQTCNGADTIGINIVSWSDTQIVLSGFGSALGSTSKISAGDPLTVMVTGPNGSGAAAFNLLVSGVQNPQPVITGISPSSVPAGASSATVTISGAGLTQASSISFNGVLHASSYVSSSQLTVALSKTDLSTVGSVAIVVTNPSPGGGTSNAVEFNVTGAAGSGSYAILHAFNGTDGVGPTGLIKGRDGSLYGTTGTGGANSMGTLFQMDAESGNISHLHSFSGPDGNGPAGLTQGTDGMFYGTSAAGGDLLCTSPGSPTPHDGCGTVFVWDASDNPPTVLYIFSGTNGLVPGGPLIQASDGMFYGTTTGGGIGTGCGAAGCGTIYRVSSPTITPTGMSKSLYSFSAPSLEGVFPYYSLFQASDGNFYGVTLLGSSQVYLAGTMFRLTEPNDLSGTYEFNSLCSFTSPSSGPLIEVNGELYGTTQGGGEYLYGMVFATGFSGCNVSTLTSFPADNGDPHTLILGSDGNFYATTGIGGDPSCTDPATPLTPGCGAIVRIDPTGNITVLHLFTGAPSDGAYASNLFDGQDGYLYGTTVYGGTANDGVVFRIPISAPVSQVASQAATQRSQAAALR